MKVSQWWKIQVNSIKAGMIIGKAGTDHSAWVSGQHIVPGLSVPEYTVYISNTFAQVKGCIDEVPAIFVTLGTNGNVFYVCNTEFTKVPTRYQTAILEHEVAHFILGHLPFTLSARLKVMFQQMFRQFHEPKSEFEADRYASEIVGGVEYRGALYFLRDIYKMYGYPVKELNKRLEALEKGE